MECRFDVMSVAYLDLSAVDYNHWYHLIHISIPFSVFVEVFDKM